MSLEEAFVAARELRLLNDATLKALLGGRSSIYPLLPTGQPPPYVHPGEVQIIDDSDDPDYCGADDGEIDEATVHSTTHVWVKPDTLEDKTGSAIGARVRALLTQDLTIEGYATLSALHVQTQRFDDPGGFVHLVIDHDYEVERTA